MYNYESMMPLNLHQYHQQQKAILYPLFSVLLIKLDMENSVSVEYMQLQYLQPLHQLLCIRILAPFLLRILQKRNSFINHETIDNNMKLKFLLQTIPNLLSLNSLKSMQMLQDNPSKSQISQRPEENSQSVSPPSIQQIVLPNGAIYKGSLNAETQKPEGRGLLLYPNKQRYEGQFQNGMKHGKGKYYYIKGELYIGDWFQNQKHGKGQYFYENGKMYTGSFQNNRKHGIGRIDETDGSYFQGQFFENDKHNAGQYYDAIENKKFLIVYEKGKQISCREIIEIDDVKNSKQTNGKLPSLLDLGIHVDNLNLQRKDILSDEKIKVDNYPNISHQKYISQCQPIMQSLRSLTFQKKHDIQSKAEMIVTNFFDKNLIDIRINQWGIKEVCQWLNQIGFGDCIQQFRDNCITGQSLLTLKNSNLKELNVAALGDRKILQRQIEFLKLIFKSQCIGDPISKLRHREVTIKLVRDLEKKKLLGKKENVEIIEELSSSTSSESGHEDRETKIKNKAKMNMQRKFQLYMEKKGIKLTFLIPKQQIQIIKPIGKGGYGQVFLGRWCGQDVAVKKYLKKQGFRNRHVGHFIEEVQVINKLLHPSIVLYMGMCVYDNEYGMITEFLSGGSLFDYLHKRGEKLTEEKIFYICKDVALGMSYLHGKNVLHCDLKSSNVLIDQNWNVKLCDFGLSRINNNTKKNKKNNSIRVGTPHWMAPQILKGEKFQCYSDVYSFGIILWEMLTGQIPYKNLATADIINLVGNDEKHHIAIPNYPNKLFLRIFLACTDREPSRRPTFKHIVEELENQESHYDSSENQKANKQ